jgi:capsular polysaccharide biosynthesis protein
VPGTVAVLATRGMANYYHFLLEIIPRVALLRACQNVPDVDWFFVDCEQRFQRELIQAAGIDERRVIEPRTHPHIRATRLIVPSLPGPRMLTAPWVVDYVRSIIPVETTRERTRLYISRGSLPNTRRVRQEPALERALADRGFTTLHLERMHVSEQAQAFNSAEMIVAPHGAGLANVVFCQPGTAVVELFAAAYVNSVFWRLAEVVPGVRYTYIAGDGSRQNGSEHGPVAADMEIDVSAVLRALDTVCAVG